MLPTLPELRGRTRTKRTSGRAVDKGDLQSLSRYNRVVAVVGANVAARQLGSGFHHNLWLASGRTAQCLSGCRVFVIAFPTACSNEGKSGATCSQNIFVLLE
jgi:hypothetical protein